MDFTTLVYVGEAEVAFKNLCTQLYEYDVVLPLREVEDLEELGRLLGVDPAYARVLRGDHS
ncbi:MafI family immunity protein [Cellulomonas massiliensis]|uniref:MafI family immunity protein n=1 Tax=Cellulomonas massiliensis TaxID=1465811 RepID=UPI00037F4FDE|nr:MafI family immunity protein [Cellulomonas massiliensis]